MDRRDRDLRKNRERERKRKREICMYINLVNSSFLFSMLPLGFEISQLFLGLFFNNSLFFRQFIILGEKY